MLKKAGVYAGVVSAIFLIIGLAEFHFGPQDSSIVSRGVIQAANLVELILYIIIVWGLSFSLSFTPILGLALLIGSKNPSPDYNKTFRTFFVSLLPFVPTLWCFIKFILPQILQHLHR